MAILPQSKIGKVQFYQGRIEPWEAAAGEIGLAADDVAALGGLTDAARVAYEEQRAAQALARAKTGAFNDAVAAMQRKGSELIKKVKAKAAGAASPGSVYSKALLPPPAEPSPIAAPGTPFKLAVTLRPDGSLGLAWKCRNPAGSTGTMYEVRRKEMGSGFVFVGATGVKSFVDQTIPAGTATVAYEITAVRSTKRGQAGVFMVNLGVAGGGEASGVVAAPKIAA